MRGWRRSRRPPRLDWVQIEVTSRCTVACLYCPRKALGSRWRHRDVAPGLIVDLLPSLRRVRHVHLQGWGEPLLHPNFFEMAAWLAEAGCRVGTTSNGALLDRSAARALVDAGVDVVALSVAGADAATNDPLRGGTPLERVVAAARALAEARGDRRRPRIHLAYMLLRSGLESIEHLPGLVERSGADEVVVSTLGLAFTPELAREAVVADGEQALEEVRARLSRVEEEVEARGARLNFRILSPLASPGTCADNPARGVFVGADGRVHPCVALGLPVEGPVEHFPWGERAVVWPRTLGDLRHETLDGIWSKAESRDFRRSVRSSSPPSGCVACPKRCEVSVAPPVDLVPPI